MNYYNVVLLPPEELSEILKDFAQKNFKDLSDGYCLSDKVLPHITLCQFKAEGALELSIDNLSLNKFPQLEKFNIYTGKDQHEGYIWCQISVTSEDWLLHLHNYVRNKLLSKEVEVLTNQYVPHVTLCRMQKRDQEKVNLENIPEEFFKLYDGWRAQVGSSDENGQYLGRLQNG